MELLIAQMITGVALGALYALFGIGFGLVAATMGILNAAQGCYASFGALAGLFAADQLNLPLPLSLLAGMGFAALVAVAVDQVGFQPLRRRGGGMLGALIVSVAVWVMLDSLLGVATRQPGRSFPEDSYPHAVLRLGIVQVPAMQIVAVLCLVLVAVGVSRVVTGTRLGAAMRAVGFNAAAAGLSGVNARLIAMVTAGLGGAAAGLAGVLAGITSADVGVALGHGLMLKGMAAVAVGGPGNVRGTVLAGLGLGLLEAVGGRYLAGGFGDVAGGALLLVFLLLRAREAPGFAGLTRA